MTTCQATGENCCKCRRCCDCGKDREKTWKQALVEEIRMLLWRSALAWMKFKQGVRDAWNGDE